MKNPLVEAIASTVLIRLGPARCSRIAPVEVMSVMADVVNGVDLNILRRDDGTDMQSGFGTDIVLYQLSAIVVRSLALGTIHDVVDDEATVQQVSDMAMARMTADRLRDLENAVSARNQRHLLQSQARETMIESGEPLGLSGDLRLMLRECVLDSLDDHADMLILCASDDLSNSGRPGQEAIDAAVRVVARTFERLPVDAIGIDDMKAIGISLRLDARSARLVAGLTRKASETACVALGIRPGPALGTAIDRAAAALTSCNPHLEARLRARMTALVQMARRNGK